MIFFRENYYVPHHGGGLGKRVRGIDYILFLMWTLSAAASESMLGSASASPLACIQFPDWTDGIDQTYRDISI